MKKVIIIFTTLLLASATIVGTTLTFKPSKKESNNIAPNEVKKDEIDIMLENMTLEEKIGQMLIIDYQKENFDEELKNLLNTVKPGGFIFFSNNFKDYDQTMKLINDIKNNATIPMFLSVDQEGGRVQRLKNLKGASITTIPSMSKIGATNDTNTAYNTGVSIAKDLNKFSLNMNFAPVLDVYSNNKNKIIGDRSFGSDPYLVSKMGIALSKGLSENGIISIYKHFPGHGNTETDSHVALPIVTKTKEELLESDLIPFKEAIKNNAEIIMIGHLAVPSITNDYTPASISKEIITDFLKNELGYQNLVITDALNMKGLTSNYTKEEIIEKALTAGVDLLLMPEDPLNAIEIIKNSITSGTISEEQINNSVKKIIKLKKKYNIIK